MVQVKITTKSLAREFNLDGPYVRKLLRRHFKRKAGHFWSWSGREAEDVRKYLRQSLNGSTRGWQ